jgi:hypothetical protein
MAEYLTFFFLLTSAARELSACRVLCTPFLCSYALQPGLRQRIPELASSSYEVVCDDDSTTFPGVKRVQAEGIQQPGMAPEGPLGAPVYVALVDTADSEDFLESVRGALHAALEALPKGALFGLISFSDRVCLHGIRGG